MATPKDMDAYAAEASKELAGLEDARIADVAGWWKRWYLKTGHKRLGRLMNAYKSPAHLPAHDSSSNGQHSNPAPDAIIIDDGTEFVFQQKAMDTARFIAVKHSGAVVSIDLNTQHPLHRYISSSAEQEKAAQHDESVLPDAEEGLRILLMAWASYELSEPAGIRRERAEATAIDWGRAARRLLNG